MKKLFVLCVLILASFQAHAVNNRIFNWDAPAVVVGQPLPAGYRLYCGITTNNPATFSPTAVFDVPAVTPPLPRAVALADNITFCAMKAYAPGGLEGVFSNVVSVTAPGAPFIRITYETFGIGPDGVFGRLSSVVTETLTK